MHLLPEKYFDNKDTQNNRKEKSSNFGRRLFLVSLLVGFILIVVASLKNSDQTEEEQLAVLQAKIEKREVLLEYEKKAYCELLWKVRKVRLCACKKNFIKDIGSLTGYKVKDSDLDWRDSGKTFEEALQEAFRRTGVPKEQFFAKKWGLDINGKSGVVEWKGPGGAEVSIDPPHQRQGPDVFHIGFQSPGKDDDRVRGHIFLDCVPFFRNEK
ncbi:MAG TPA: polymorphic toxin type 47 domain-containing protein [Leptospiraceae bacterium]|nr:polymorphic toxin type 47 domain-containing protein [Leptospiraceae bacterium]HRG76238.1 polymorphic toxin type 47 domain-containing protein [Leptospiraceae bacterium]